MLILSRKRDESVVVGGSDGFHRLLKVKVLECSGGGVTLGFDVDPEVPVFRAEDWERIRAGDVKAFSDSAPVEAADLHEARGYRGSHLIDSQ